MEKFTPENNNQLAEKYEKTGSFLERFRKTGIWTKGLMTATLFASSILGHAKEGEYGNNEKIESIKSKSSVSIMNAFDKGVPEMNENKDIFIKSFQEILTEMSLEELLDFINDPNKMFAVRASSDRDPILKEKNSRDYGVIKDNKDLTNARASEGEKFIREAIKILDHPEADDKLDKFIREELLKKIIRRFTPVNGITTHEEIIKAIPELKGASEKTLNDIARYVEVGIISESGPESDNGIVEDFSKYTETILMVDLSGSMRDDAMRIAMSVRNIPMGNRVVWQGFTDHLLGSVVVTTPQQLRNLAEKIGVVQMKSVDEQAIGLLPEVITKYNIVPENSKDDVSRVVEVMTDEKLLNVSIDRLEKIISMANERNMEIKVSLKDHKAGFNGALRTFTIGAFINTIEFKFPGANKDELFSININGGRMYVTPMSSEKTDNLQVAVN